MKIRIKDVTVVGRNIDSARIRDLVELQTQTGMKLPEIREAGKPGALLTAPVIAFLSMRGAGHAFTWEDALDLSLDEIRVVVEPGDRPAVQEDEQADPPQPSGDSAPDGDAPAEATASSARRPSKRRSPGSPSK
ncbi:hypothetical protein AB1K56_07970 [Microbacterium sp. BWR-S6Y]|uniref:hypothetical protein n=1 Tax=Microbacterium sp. BWR-S6Y TaxID=3232073 RepID=UPI003528267B